MNRCVGAAAAALGHHIAGTAFAVSALRGNAQFKLNLVKRHACMRVACDLSVRNAVAYTNNHGVKQLWLAVERMADYK